MLSWKRWIAITGLAVLGLAAVACGSPAATATVGGDSRASQAQIADLQRQLDEQKAATVRLESQLNETNQTLDVRTAMLQGLLNEAKQRDESDIKTQDLERKLAGLKSISTSLENDRELLVELRKDAPTDNTTALLEHWRNVRSLAAKSDPALVRPADRLVTAAEAFAAWVEKDYPSEREAEEAYYASGADQYPTRVEEFRRAVLLVMIFRLEGVIQQTQ